MIASKSGTSLLVALSVLLPGVARAADADSRYTQLATDSAVADGARKTLLSVTVTGGHAFLISATGSLIPGGTGVAKIYITVDGRTVSNISAIDWSQTPNPAEHSFAAIGAPWLSPGPHRVAVIAEGSASFSVRAGLNLSVMGHPSQALSSSGQMPDSPVVSADSSGIVDGLTALPGNTMLALHLPARGSQTAILLAGNATFSGQGAKQYGDAMWALQTDGVELASDKQSYAVNDIWFKSEVSAPMFVQGLLDQNEGGATIGFKPSVEPWGKALGAGNPVHYQVTNQATLIALSGGFNVFGGLSSLGPTIPGKPYRRFTYKCVGTSRNAPSCPPVGSTVQLANGTFEVPQGHNGIIYFSGVARIQGATMDGGGSVTVNIMIDGQVVGSTAHQALNLGDTISTRTVEVSYLSAGKQSLSVGKHTIAMTAKAEGDFLQLAIPKGLHVIWFD